MDSPACGVSRRVETLGQGEGIPSEDWPQQACAVMDDATRREVEYSEMRTSGYAVMFDRVSAGLAGHVSPWRSGLEFQV